MNNTLYHGHGHICFINMNDAHVIYINNLIPNIFEQKFMKGSYKKNHDVHVPYILAYKYVSPISRKYFLRQILGNLLMSRR